VSTNNIYIDPLLNTAIVAEALEEFCVADMWSRQCFLYCNSKFTFHALGWDNKLFGKTDGIVSVHIAGYQALKKPLSWNLDMVKGLSLLKCGLSDGQITTYLAIWPIRAE